LRDNLKRIGLSDEFPNRDARQQEYTQRKAVATPPQESSR
jgi:hypothetical protein